MVVNLGSLPLKSSWEFLPRITLIFTNRKRKKFASIRETCPELVEGFAAGFATAPNGETIRTRMPRITRISRKTPKNPCFFRVRPVRQDKPGCSRELKGVHRMNYS